MRKNNWLSYFAYAVLLLCYIVFSFSILGYLKNQAKKTFNILPLEIWSIVLFIILGLLLGLEKFLLELRKEGKWKVNLPKILFLGILSLYFSMGTYIYYCPIAFVSETLAYPVSILLKSNVSYTPIFHMMLGYVIVTSFIKVKKC